MATFKKPAVREAIQCFEVDVPRATNVSTALEVPIYHQAVGTTRGLAQMLCKLLFEGFLIVREVREENFV
eukprot:1175416-Pyramimonas_sp.AAC.1